MIFQRAEKHMSVLTTLPFYNQEQSDEEQSEDKETTTHQPPLSSSRGPLLQIACAEQPGDEDEERGTVS